MTEAELLQSTIPNIGIVSIRSIAEAPEREGPESVYEDWGPMAPEAQGMQMVRWLIELTDATGVVAAVGDLSAHAVWYGPTPTSKAMNIGISIDYRHRGKGIGSVAQRLVAQELHRQGFARVEAGTDIENIPEQKSLLKAGFFCEGVARQAQGRADGIHDLQVWSHISGA